MLLETPQIRENVGLAPLTTMRVGGPARFFTEVHDTDELATAIHWAKATRVPFFILGGGSNVIVSDAGFDGLVIKMAIRGIDVEPKEGSVHLTVGAGEPWDEFVSLCVRRGYTGIECLSGIPGLAGATPIQNVGAYGQEVSETITAVEVLETSTGEAGLLSNDECRFGYRCSRFKAEAPGRFVVTRVSYRLSAGGAPSVRYPDLEKALATRNAYNPAVADVREAVLSIRRSKGMVIDPNDPDTRSVGSFFVNPIVRAETLDQVMRRAHLLGFNNPLQNHKLEGDRFKLSAAQLIEASGFTRGFVKGNARISTKHSLAITNPAAATASEILALADEIKAKVLDYFGVRLTPEPLVLGRAAHGGSGRE